MIKLKKRINLKKLLIILSLILLLNSCSIDEEQNITGPYYDQILLATSNDGEKWKLDENPIQEHASVPDALQLDYSTEELDSGTIMVVFVDASELEGNTVSENIGLIESKDNGVTWSSSKILNIEGAEELIPVDPSLVQLKDGTLLLYFLDFTAIRYHRMESNTKYQIYVASSRDGENFKVEQVVLTHNKAVTDPEIIFYNNLWYMYLSSENGIVVATSENGLSFDNVQEINVDGIPGTEIKNNKIELFGCDIGNITQVISNDGILFENKRTILAGRFCDPSPVELDDGSSLLLIKTDSRIKNFA